MENIKTINKEWDVPLVGVSSASTRQLNLFLKTRDVKPVQSVIGHLESRQLYPYFGGKLVTDKIFGKSRGNYGEVVLVGVGNDKMIEEVISDITDSLQFRPREYAKGIERPWFSVKRRHTELGYHDLGCFDFNERFQLATISPGLLSRNPSPIDLYLISKDKI